MRVEHRIPHMSSRTASERTGHTALEDVLPFGVLRGLLGGDELFEPGSAAGHAHESLCDGRLQMRPREERQCAVLGRALLEGDPETDG